MILSQFIVILALIRARMEGFRRASSFGPILAPQEGPVEHGTCSTNHGTHLEGLLSQKKMVSGGPTMVTYGGISESQLFWASSVSTRGSS